MHTDICWSPLFPMKLKRKGQKTFSLLFQQDGMSPTAIYRNVKEMFHGEFNRKLKEALCHLKQMEPFTPWSNAAKRKIKKLTEGSSRKLIKSGAPKRLWHDCLELEFYLKSDTEHSIDIQDGEVPEMIMSSKTSDTTLFCVFDWFK